MSAEPRTALVTGATGFVGANLARALLRAGNRVDLLASRADRAWRIEEIRGEAAFHVCDLDDAPKLGRLLERLRPSWVFHCAAYGAYSWQQDLDRMLRTNVSGTIHLLKACRDAGVESFVHTGSSSEYGYKDHAPREDEVLEPNSDYAATKAMGSTYARWFAQEEKIRVTILRLYSVYGPWEDPGRFFPTLIREGLAGRYPPLVAPSVARDYVSAEDVGRACLMAAARSRGPAGAVYNVGTGVQTTVAEVVDMAGRMLAIPGEPVWGSMPDRRWDTSTWVADPRRIREDLGWEPADSLEEGFRRMVDWSRREAGGTLAAASR